MVALYCGSLLTAAGVTAAPAGLQAVSLRSNLSLMWSRVDQVLGPNNRLEGQPPWTANLGADWPIKGLPLTVGGSLNFTPGFELQQIDQQVSRQGLKSVLDAYGKVLHI